MKALSNLVVLALVVAAGYYGYTNLMTGDDSPGEESSAPTGFNCRGALAQLAKLYECRDAAGCSLTTAQEQQLREVESGIEENCN